MARTYGDVIREYGIDTGNDDTNKQIENMYSQSYRQMMDAENQAAAARANALKYTQNQLNASGYGTQGVAESTRMGIENSYRNAMANASSDFNKSMIDNYNAAMGLKQQNESNLRSDYSDFIYSAKDVNELGNYAKEFGAELNDDGTWKYDPSTSKYSDTFMRYLSNLSKTAKDSFSTTTYDSNGNPTVKDNNTGLSVTTNSVTGSKRTYGGTDGKTYTDMIIKNVMNDKQETALRTELKETGHNDKFMITIGETTYKVEMGKKMSKYSIGWEKGHDDTSKMSVGEIGTFTNANGKTFFYIIDENNEPRMIERAAANGRSSNQEILKALGKAFGVNGDTKANFLNGKQWIK